MQQIIKPDQAPALTLDFAANNSSNGNVQSKGSIKTRAQTAKCHGKGHNIVQKDYYRLMKEDSIV